MSTSERALANHVEILIAEDSATQAEQLKFLLEQSGYAVTLAADGRQALEAAQRRKPTLLISDIIMPEMDGYALCRAIKADEALSDIPIILVTALSGPHDVVRGLESGADNFIRKPYEEKHLLQRIRYLLANQALRRSEKVQMGIEIDLGGQRHFITAGRQQILDLLISTYEEAMRLNQNLEQSYQTLNGLFRVAEGLNQCTTEQDVIEKVLERGLELPGVQAGWVFLREREGGLRLAAARNLPPALAAAAAMEGDCLCRRELLAGNLDRVVNILDCVRLQQAAGDAPRLRYHASVPLWIGDELLGVMNLVGAEEGLFDEEELKVLHGVGHQVGQAMSRAHLHEHLERLVAERTAALTAEIAVRNRAEERIQRQLQRLASLRAIDMAISASLDLRITLSVVLDQVVQQLGVDAATVLLLDRHTHTLEYAAGRGFRSSAIEGSRLRLGEGYTGRAALERRTVYVPDLTTTEFSRARLLAGERFIAHYAVPLMGKGEVKGVLDIFHRAPLEADEEWLDFMEALAGQAAIAIDNAQLFDGLQRSNLELNRAYDATIEGWSRAMDLRDKETEGHTRRVAELTVQLAREMGMRSEEIVHLRRGALLHDIGKLGVPDGILLKPAVLTDEEWEIMRRHPQYAYEMLWPIDYLRPAIDIPWCHHENWDGRGYPRGLKGAEIPLAARLFTVVDVWDALTSDRPYRQAWPREKALEYIRTQAGMHFDPQAVELFFQVLSDEV